MSVRRLAEANVQPAAFAFDASMAGAVDTWIAKYPKGRQQSAVIPLLMLAQEQEGWVTKPAIEAIADMLGMPYIRALEVATFYTQFQLKPVGTRAHVQVCGTTPCMLRGSEALMDVCRSKIHHDQFHANAAGTLSWEEVECLGACVNAPMVMIFKDTFEDLTPERLAEIIDLFEAGQGAAVPVGPQNGRRVSAPQAGLTTLTDEAAILPEARQQETAAPQPGAAAGGVVPPSNAAKPRSDAIETDKSMKSPSPQTAPAGAESLSPAPAFDKAAADLSEPAVEGSAKPRSRPKPRTGEAATFVSTETPGGAPSPQTTQKPSLEDPARPAGIEKPAAVDDLKLISGIGPKNEAILHALGIYTYAQVAAWTDAQRRWVDGYLNFSGRIDREDWAGQAGALAKGGVAEYVRVFGKKPR